MRGGEHSHSLRRTAYWQGISTAAKTNGGLRTAKNKAHLNIKGLKVGVNRLNRKAAKRVVGYE